MIEKYKTLKFSYAYQLAGFLRQKVFENNPEDHLIDLIDPEHEKILKPDKKTVLHDYIEYEFTNEIEYYGRKLDYDTLGEDWESLLTDYNIFFSKEEWNEDEEEYFNYLETKIIENIACKIANETFHLLFSDRMFCLKFNKIIADNVSNYELKDYPEILSEDGKPKRLKYIPVWVKKAVYLRDRGSCAVCLTDLTGLLKTTYKNAIDHIVPLNLGGINDISNFQLICESCNLKKLGHTILTSEDYPTYF